MRELVDLGVPGLQPLAFLRRSPDAWRRVFDRAHATHFLRSEGLSVALGPPQRATGALLATCRDVAERFARFFAHVARAYVERPELAPEYMLEPLLQPLVEDDQTMRTTTPLARLDCVLDATGNVSVIEINPVGGNLLHMRNVFYLLHHLERAGLHDAAAELEPLALYIVAAFERHYRLNREERRAHPMVGCVTARGWMRGSNPLFRAVFHRFGWRYVWGDARSVTVDAHGIQVRGEPVDVLWHDLLGQPAYQAARYVHTQWHSRPGDLSGAPDDLRTLLANAQLREHLRSRRVVGISPGTSYLAMSKSLLAWIHDPERPCPADDRAWLAAHVARTYSVRERRVGTLTLEQALDERETLLLKPCLYGGSHGVEVGRATSADRWSEAVRAIWDDPTWVLQRFIEPVRSADGQWLSLGLSAFEGLLGGISLRTSPGLVISARDAGYIPVVV